MKKLIFLRHAEAQSTHCSAVDWERPLALTGLRQLEERRPSFQNMLKKVDFILCSNAKRTRQTLEAVRSFIPSKCDVEYTDRLYQVNSDTILAQLTNVKDLHQTILLIGHNPSLSDFLVRVADVHPFPIGSGLGTADVACFGSNFDSWSEAAYTRFQIECIVRL